MSVRFGAKKQADTDQKVEKVVEESASYGNAPLQQKQLNTVWEEYAEQQEGFVKQTLMLANPEVKGDTVIGILLENSFQAEKVMDVKSAMMPYLRNKLNNDSITLDVKISAALESNKAFTPKEKLERLMKDNPALVKLIDTLALEME